MPLTCQLCMNPRRLAYSQSRKRTGFSSFSPHPVAPMATTRNRRHNQHHIRGSIKPRAEPAASSIRELPRIHFSWRVPPKSVRSTTRIRDLPNHQMSALPQLRKKSRPIKDLQLSAKSSRLFPVLGGRPRGCRRPRSSVRRSDAHCLPKQPKTLLEPFPGGADGCRDLDVDQAVEQYERICLETDGRALRRLVRRGLGAADPHPGLSRPHWLVGPRRAPPRSTPPGQRRQPQRARRCPAQSPRKVGHHRARVGHRLRPCVFADGAAGLVAHDRPFLAAVETRAALRAASHGCSSVYATSEGSESANRAA